MAYFAEDRRLRASDGGYWCNTLIVHQASALETGWASAVCGGADIFRIEFDECRICPVA